MFWNFKFSALKQESFNKENKNLYSPIAINERKSEKKGIEFRKYNIEKIDILEIENIIKALSSQKKTYSIRLNDVIDSNNLQTSLFKFPEIEDIDLETIEVIDHNNFEMKKVELVKYDITPSGNNFKKKFEFTSAPVQADLWNYTSGEIENLLDEGLWDESDLIPPINEGCEKKIIDKVDFQFNYKRTVFTFDFPTQVDFIKIKDIRTSPKKPKKIPENPNLDTKQIPKENPKASNKNEFAINPSNPFQKVDLNKTCSNDSANLPIHPFPKQNFQPVIQSKGILKPARTNPEESYKNISKFNITYLNTIEDVKRLSIEKSLNSYSTPTSSKILIKVYINSASSLSKSVVESLNNSKYNIVPLEVPEKFMDSIDIIINWQFGVKFIYNSDIKKYDSIKSYLESFYDYLFNFELVFLVYYTDPITLNSSYKETLKEFESFLISKNLDCSSLTTYKTQPITKTLLRFLDDYLHTVQDLNRWNYLQEQLNENLPRVKESWINIYVLHILLSQKSLEDFVKTCNLLSISGSSKVQQLFLYLKYLPDNYRLYSP